MSDYDTDAAVIGSARELAELEWREFCRSNVPDVDDLLAALEHFEVFEESVGLDDCWSTIVAHFAMLARIAIQENWKTFDLNPGQMAFLAQSLAYMCNNLLDDDTRRQMAERLMPRAVH